MVKYCVLIIDGAAGLPLPAYGGKTSLEIARTPHMDKMTGEGTLGLVPTVPPGMEPSSACACMSLLGYDPEVYYQGRAGIEAKSLDIPVGEGEVVFRCNLVTSQNGRMQDYSSGYISTDEAQSLIAALNQRLGTDDIHFYPGVSYRHICKIKGHEDTLMATCTPPHDIPDQPIAEFMPRGIGSDRLRHLMLRSMSVLGEHPVNLARQARGEPPATMVWLFWGSGRAPEMPAFDRVYGIKAAMTSGVDLLRGLARMMGMTVLEIPGVTAGPDNDYAAQASGALKTLKTHDLVVIHVEAPDEASHAGLVKDKVAAIEMVDREIVRQLRASGVANLRVLLMPDHATPIKTRTHSAVPVPFLLWGSGITANDAARFTETEAKNTGLLLEKGYHVMGRLIGD